MTNRMPSVRHSLSIAALLAAGGAGCASDPANPGPGPMDEDTTAPQVVSSTPGTSATGVPANAKIVVTFSEAMDPGTVEAAYSSEQLPIDKVSFEWNTELTVLSISPDSPLEYAEGFGVDPASVEGLRYAITIGASAADLAGNPLDNVFELSFATRKRMTAELALDLDYTRIAVGSNVYSNTEILVGDMSNTTVSRGYLTFNLAPLPADAEVEAARLSARQLVPQGAPYTLGAVIVQHLTYSSLNGNLLATLLPISVPGLFSDNATLETKSVDVTSQVRDDLEKRVDRSHRSQYRMLIEQATNNDDVTDRASFAKDTFHINVTYVAD